MDCPLCKGRAICYYYEWQKPGHASEYHDRYVLHCDVCGIVNSQILYGGDSTRPAADTSTYQAAIPPGEKYPVFCWPTVCPFCGVDFSEHAIITKEVMEKLIQQEMPKLMTA